MAGMTKNDSAASPVSEMVTENGVGSKDPFQGDSQRFTWTRQVEVGQLQAEVVEALGASVQVAAIIPIDEGGQPGPVSEQDPITFFVTPSSVDLAAVRRVLAEHRPDPYYGMDEDQKAQAQLREKIAAGEALSPEEMTRALQMLI